jgi:uncharacterized protein YciI
MRKTIILEKILTMHFFYKLIAPRHDFHMTMEENEQTAMGQHMVYWADLFKNGVVAVYGPVFDPQGVFGMAVLEVDNEDQANSILTNDPAVASGVCTAQLLPMEAGMIRSR